MFELNHQQISVATVGELVSTNKSIKLGDKSIEAIVKCRQYLDEKMAEEGTLYYGINTGFGSLCDVEISKNEIAQLQYNLVVSHACGTGLLVPEEIVKTMLLLKVLSLSYGHSGVALSTVQRLIDMYNHNILPVVFDTGSLGASGDLSPLAHLSLPLLGLGEVWYEGKRVASKNALSDKGWDALTLQSKEGLALLNGTQFMSAYAVHLINESTRLFQQMDTIAAMSLDGFDCRMEPFHHLVHQIRPHAGQLATAKFIMETLSDSEIAQQAKKQVQDPYSFRCIPQVHGASKDVLTQVTQTITTEINSVTDNPNVFPDEDLIISAGNFHGQPLAMALDYLKLAIAEMGNISERRVYLMLSGQRDLPTYLTAKSGLHSGMMIPQYSAAAIVSKNKQLCTPASADSVPSSNGQEDHVSMGANAATQCLEILNNTRRIAGIELLNAAQALDFRGVARTSKKLQKLHAAYRKKVKRLSEDRVLHNDIVASEEFLLNLH